MSLWEKSHNPISLDRFESRFESPKKPKSPTNFTELKLALSYSKSGRIGLMEFNKNKNNGDAFAAVEQRQEVTNSHRTHAVDGDRKKKKHDFYYASTGQTGEILMEQQHRREDRLSLGPFASLSERPVTAPQLIRPKTSDGRGDRENDIARASASVDFPLISKYQERPKTAPEQLVGLTGATCRSHKHTSNSSGNSRQFDFLDLQRKKVIENDIEFHYQGLTIFEAKQQFKSSYVQPPVLSCKKYAIPVPVADKANIQRIHS